MVQIQYPYIDESGISHDNLIKHWTDDETKVLLQVETGVTYEEAVDIYPCIYTYVEQDKPEDPEESEETAE